MFLTVYKESCHSFNGLDYTCPAATQIKIFTTAQSVRSPFNKNHCLPKPSKLILAKKINNYPDGRGQSLGVQIYGSLS